jgi:hypothetical protein
MEPPQNVTLKQRMFRLLFIIVLAFITKLVFDQKVQTILDRLPKRATHESLADLATRYRESGCPAHEFKAVRHLSRSPKMLLIDQFLTAAEAAALVQIA